MSKFLPIEKTMLSTRTFAIAPVVAQVILNESIVAGATVPVSVAVLQGNLIKFHPTLKAVPSACVVCATEAQ